jgi:hypothetical protein
VVTPGDVQDRHIIAPLLAIARERFPSLKSAIADGGYQGKLTADEVQQQAGIPLEIRPHVAAGESTHTGLQNHKRFCRLKKIPDGLLEPDSIRYIEVVLDPFASRMAVTPAAIKHLEDRQRILCG